MTESFDIDVEGCDEGQFSGSSPEHANMALMGGGNPLNRAGVKRSAGEREEMIMRKKLRNRESAQRARDRQKAKMRWLEEELQRMKIKNEQLLRENLILRHMVQDQAKNTIPTGLGQPGLVNPLQNLPKTATPQSPAQTAFQVQLARQQAQQQAALRQQQQVQVNPAQNQLQLIQQQQLLQQATAQLNSNPNKKLHPNGSHDSDNSVPSVLSTGSQAGLASHTINQRGDELLKAAAAKTNQGLPNTTTQQQAAAAQQYAAALAALSNSTAATTTTNNQVLQSQHAAGGLMNPAQLAAAMAQATVAAAQQTLQQQQQQQQAVAAVVQQPVEQPQQQNQQQKGRPSSVGSQPSGCHTSDDDK